MWNFRYDECHKQRCGLWTDPEGTANVGCPSATDHLSCPLSTDDDLEAKDNQRLILFILIVISCIVTSIPNQHR
jgi:hypothetical protein